MSAPAPQDPDSRQAALEALAHAKRRGVLGEVLGFLRHNKKWWLTPIIVVLLLMGGLIALSSSAVAPFIYTLF